MAKLPSKETQDRLRRAVETVGKVDSGRLLDQSQLVNQVLKGRELTQIKKTGENIARILESVTGPALRFRTDNHKLLEAIGTPAFGTGSIPVLAHRNAHPSDQPKAITTAADIGKLVRNARKEMGMTQQRFADLAGVGRRFLSELEGGKASLEIGRVLAVCKAAGIDLFARRR
jgi:y4mF family transcriptional regulator